MTTEYIISEELANKVCAILINYGENRVANKLCSRPAASLTESEITNKILRMVESDEWQKEHDAAIRNEVLDKAIKEIGITRDKLGNEFTTGFETDEVDLPIISDAFDELNEKLESLRTPGTADKGGE